MNINVISLKHKCYKAKREYFVATPKYFCAHNWVTNLFTFCELVKVSAKNVWRICDEIRLNFSSWKHFYLQIQRYRSLFVGFTETPKNSKNLKFIRSNLITQSETLALDSGDCWHRKTNQSYKINSMEFNLCKNA